MNRLSEYLHPGPDHAVGAHTDMPRVEFRRVPSPSDFLRPGSADILGAIKAMREGWKVIVLDEAGDPEWRSACGSSKVDLIRSRQAAFQEKSR